VTTLIKLCGHLGRHQDKTNEHAEVLRRTYIADVVVATIIILLCVYCLFTNNFICMEVTISSRHEFLHL